jgi:hypothetical protein
MAKRKKTTGTTPASSTPPSTASLVADPGNPRRMSDRARSGLSASLDEFGDLSGIVWNRKTGQVVAGHRRLEEIHKRWGEHPIEIIDPAQELGIIRIDKDHAFSVRVVDWTPEKQAAANVTANNPKIQGEFTDDLASFLVDAAAAMPAQMDDLLLADLLETYVESETPLTTVDVKPPPVMTWILVGIRTTKFGEIAQPIDAIANTPGVVIETTSNDGR